MSSSSSSSAKSAIVIITEGSEEMETVISTSVLRRAGVRVTLAGLDGSGPNLGRKEMRILPDCSLKEAMEGGKEYDAVVLPGGQKVGDRLIASSDLGVLLRQQDKSGRLIAAICAAPLAIKAHLGGADKGRKRRITSYPTWMEKLDEDFVYCPDEAVVVDGNMITSQGPATAFAFAIKIVEMLLGEEAVESVKKEILFGKM